MVANGFRPVLASIITVIKASWDRHVRCLSFTTRSFDSLSRRRLEMAEVRSTGDNGAIQASEKSAVRDHVIDAD